jgi:hypothetical protein
VSRCESARSRSANRERRTLCRRRGSARPEGGTGRGSTRTPRAVRGAARRGLGTSATCSSVPRGVRRGRVGHCTGRRVAKPAEWWRDCRPRAAGERTVLPPFGGPAPRPASGRGWRWPVRCSPGGALPGDRLAVGGGRVGRVDDRLIGRAEPRGAGGTGTIFPGTRGRPATWSPPTSPLVRTYCATTPLDLADCGPDPALLMAWTVNR